MALGGVEIGRNKAVEADSATTSEMPRAYSGSKDTPKGIRILAAAVLLIILDNSVVKRPSTKAIR